jgi:hypothetical protein
MCKVKIHLFELSAMFEPCKLLDQLMFDDLFGSLGFSIDAEPTPDGIEAMQQLLDGVPERWRDADLAVGRA